MKISVASKQKHRKRNTNTGSQKWLFVSGVGAVTKKFGRKLFSQTEAFERVLFNASYKTLSILFA